MARAKLHVRTGCSVCKGRKKKCDEKWPTCGACQRLGLRCVYGTAAKPRNPQLEICATIATSPFNAPEAAVIARVPSSVRQSFCPSVNSKAGDMQVLVQLTWTYPAVRSAVVACFSRILPARSQSYGDLNQDCLGNALRLVRKQVAGNLDATTLFSLMVSVNYLGLLDVAGLRDLCEPPIHFLALAALVGRLEKERHELPSNMITLATEGIVFNIVTSSVFVRDLTVVDDAWRRHDVPCLLRRRPQPWRSNSMLLGGQYELWIATYEVMRMLRGGPRVEPTDEVKNVDTRYTSAADETPSMRAMTDLYRLHQIALLLCFATADIDATALRKLTKQGLEVFLQWRLVPMTYVAAVWPLAVLACAIEEADDWESYDTKLGELQRYLSPGHMQMLKSVSTRVVACRKTSSELPGALFLLKQKGGVLQDSSSKADHNVVELTDR